MDKKYITINQVDKELNFTEEEQAQINEEYNYLKTLSLLKEERKRKGITQDKLAKLSGIPRPMISKIENGRRNATIESLSKIAYALGKRLEIRLV